MSSEIKSVIIVGASGNLGPTILKTLLSDSHFNISVLSRSTSKATFPPGVNTIRADFDSVDSLTSAFKGQDAVISLVAAVALTDQSRLVDAAIAAGVKRFLPSEYGSNTLDERVIELVPTFNAKKDAVAYLKSKEDKISWTSVITGPFFDWGLGIGFLGFNAATKTATIIDQGKGTFTSTNLRTIGLALIKILEKPELSKNQYVVISSFQTSQADLLPVVEKATGSKFDVKHVTSKGLLESGNEKIKKGDMSGIHEVIQAVAFGENSYGDSTPMGLWNEKLGLEKEDFEESVRLGMSGKLVGE